MCRRLVNLIGGLAVLMLFPHLTLAAPAVGKKFALVVGIIIAFAVTRRSGGSSKDKGEPEPMAQDDGMASQSAEPSEADSPPADDGAVESEP